MIEPRRVKVAIADYGLGNLFSVKQACDQAGMDALISVSAKEIAAADAVILPGVGAFGDAMKSLNQLGLTQALLELAQTGKPLIGICLGMQLLMTESFEFGWHPGLGIIEGSVVRFENLQDAHGKLKVPQIGWNRIFKKSEPSWIQTPLEGLADGDYMYFVHSYYVKPAKASVDLSISRYGGIEFCSSLAANNVIAFQFHPERSGVRGLKIYKNIALWIARQKRAREVFYAGKGC